jgi:hypothetical protein
VVNRTQVLHTASPSVGGWHHRLKDQAGQRWERERRAGLMPASDHDQDELYADFR